MTRQANYTKEAVDKGARDYWRDYFGGYGQQWTDDVPRRVAQAVLQARSIRSAKSVNAAPEPKYKKVQVAPLGWVRSTTGGLIFEGVFRAQTKTATAPVVETFCAEFDGLGKLLRLDRLAA